MLRFRSSLIKGICRDRLQLSSINMSHTSSSSLAGGWPAFCLGGSTKSSACKKSVGSSTPSESFSYSLSSIILLLRFWRKDLDFFLSAEPFENPLYRLAERSLGFEEKFKGISPMLLLSENLGFYFWLLVLKGLLWSFLRNFTSL